MSVDTDQLAKQLPVPVELVAGQPGDDNLCTCSVKSQANCTQSAYSMDHDEWGPDALNATWDIEFYAAPDPAGCDSAEYGLGGGRLLSRLHPLYGVEQSQNFIERCRPLSERTQFIQGDFLTTRLPESVDYAYSAGGTFNNIIGLAQLEQVACTIGANLRPGGQLRFDLISTEFYDNVAERLLGEWFVVPGATIGTRERYRRVAPRHYIHEFIEDAPGTNQNYYHLHESTFSPEEVERTLRTAGFSHIEFQSSPSEARFVPTAHAMFVTAKA